MIGFHTFPLAGRQFVKSRFVARIVILTGHAPILKPASKRRPLSLEWTSQELVQDLIRVVPPSSDG